MLTIYLKGQTDRGVAEIALQYNSSYNELLLSFANNVNTPDGGTHEEGFKNSLTRVFINPIPVKAAMNMLGWEVGPLRMPLSEMEEEHQKELKAAMDAFGVKAKGEN